jgi:hypothetical protein
MRETKISKPLHEWRAIKNVAYPKYWGIETTDPIALESGDEIVVAPSCMSEIAAKTIVSAYNAAVRELAAQSELLSNPIAVHINMCRGTIAKPSWENLRHLYPRIYDLEHEARRGSAVSSQEGKTP